MAHPRARLSVFSRQLLVKRVMIDGWPTATVAEQLGISRPMVQQAYRTLEERDVTSAVRGGSTSIALGADTRLLLVRRMFSNVIAAARNFATPLKREQIHDAYQLEEDRHFRTRRRLTEEEPAD